MLKARLFLPFLVLVLGALLGGCQPSPTIGDNVQFDISGYFFGLPVASDSLHLPYVAGAQIDLTIYNVSSNDAAAFTVRSDNDAVFSVDSMDPGTLTAHCTARSAGTATVEVLQGGSPISSSQVTVAVPNRATLSPAGPLLVGEPMPVDVPNTTKVLTDGTATFQIQYFSGQTRLFGNGILSATADDTLVATPETTFFTAENEWLAVSPSSTGSHAVQLFANDVPLGTLTVDAVESSVISRVALESEDPDSQPKGATLIVLAQSFDSDGVPVFGVSYAWNFAGEDQEIDGDLFEFPRDPSASNNVTASFKDLTASTSIEADPGTGTVDSSNQIGCAVRRARAGDGQTHGTIMMVVAIVGLTMAAGRRRRGVRAAMRPSRRPRA